MDDKEFNEQVGRILGIKTATVAFAVIQMASTDHLEQRVSLGIIPTKIQAQKLKGLALEFGNFREIEL